jgi:hypothetical protein
MLQKQQQEIAAYKEAGIGRQEVLAVMKKEVWCLVCVYCVSSVCV